MFLETKKKSKKRVRLKDNKEYKPHSEDEELYCFPYLKVSWTKNDKGFNFGPDMVKIRKDKGFNFGLDMVKIRKHEGQFCDLIYSFSY